MLLSQSNSDKSNMLRSDPDSGRLEDTFLNLRILVIDEQFYKGLRNKLYSKFQSGASVILYDMGLGYGEIMGRNMNEMKISKFELINKFMELGRTHGYGVFHTPLLKMILSGIQGEPSVRIENCFFATSVGNTGKSECYIMAGIIAGASQIILDKNFTCIEEKCLCKGDPYCEFKLRKT